MNRKQIYDEAIAQCEAERSRQAAWEHGNAWGSSVNQAINEAGAQMGGYGGGMSMGQGGMFDGLRARFEQPVFDGIYARPGLKRDQSSISYTDTAADQRYVQALEARIVALEADKAHWDSIRAQCDMWLNSDSFKFGKPVGDIETQIAPFIEPPSARPVPCRKMTMDDVRTRWSSQAKIGKISGVDPGNGNHIDAATVREVTPCPCGSPTRLAGPTHMTRCSLWEAS